MKTIKDITIGEVTDILKVLIQSGECPDALAQEMALSCQTHLLFGEAAQYIPLTIEYVETEYNKKHRKDGEENA